MTTRRFLFLLAHLVLSSGSLIAREPMRPGTLWETARLSEPPKADWGERSGLVQQVLYRGEPFEGKPTRVFAYVGRPEGTGPFPGVVLVHGGGGQAFKEWAEHWARRGYVSIAMDTSGNGVDRQRLADGGPDQADPVKFRAFGESDARDMWTYHAVADVILAHSLLLSLPEVNPDRTALTGISWGGYLTCITAGIDPRFKAAVPVYGCGFLHDNSVWEDRGTFRDMDAVTRRLWIHHFDPGQHLARTRCPILFLNGTNDFAYPLDSYRKTIEQVDPALATVAIQHRLKHGHYWDMEIVDAFIDSILTGGRQLARLGELRLEGSEARAPIVSEAAVTSAELWFTSDGGEWQERVWKSAPATIEGREIHAKLPAERPIAFFLQATDESGLRTSTTHTQLAALNNPTIPETVPTSRLEQDFYDWHRRHAAILRVKHEIDPDYVLIGDSITHLWGGHPAEPGRAVGAEAWDSLFGDRALNLGFGWDRTQNVLWRIDHGELDGLKPKLVVIHIGTNNLASTDNYQAGSPEAIAAGIRVIGMRVKEAIIPAPRIVLMAVFPRGEKPDHPMRQPIAEINARLVAVAEELGAEYLDIGSRLLDQDGVYSQELARDFLHPTARGYQIWADALRAFVGAGGG